MPERAFRFGFLASDWSFRFAGCSIEPLPDFAERWGAVQPDVNPQDGFVYPPTEKTVTYPVDRPDQKKTVEGTRRTRLLWSLPASHVLRLPSRKVRDVEQEDVWFLVNLLAYLFGVRLKPEAWSFDGRVAVRLHRRHNVHFSREAAQHFISESYATWRGWP